MLFVFLVGINQTISAQETWLKDNLGLDFGIPGPSLKFPSVSLGIWTAASERSWLGLEAGYGGRGLLIKRNKFDRTYRESHERYFVSTQYGYVIRSKSQYIHYLTIGMYYMSMNAEIGRGFIDDMPAGAITAHSGAEYHVWRLGILPGTGIRAFTGCVSFNAQVQIPIYYEESSFENIQNPLLVVDLDPNEVQEYQHKVSHISAGFVISIRAGLVFKRSRDKSLLPGNKD